MSRFHSNTAPSLSSLIKVIFSADPQAIVRIYDSVDTIACSYDGLARLEDIIAEVDIFRPVAHFSYEDDLEWVDEPYYAIELG